MSEPIDQQIRGYADFCAKHATESVLRGDVAWQLRQYLGDPNAGVPDAPVSSGAPVKLRSMHPAEEIAREFCALTQSDSWDDMPRVEYREGLILTFAALINSGVIQLTR